MKMHTIATLIAATVTFGTAQAINYPAGNVTFNGSLSSTTCTFNLSGQGTTSSTVTLPIVPLTPFTNTGDVAGPTAFDLNITNCNASMNNMEIMFDGQQYNQTEFFSNTAASNPATGIGLLLMHYNPFYTMSPRRTFPVTLMGGAVTVPLTAWYVQLDSIQPTSGNVFVSTVLNVVY